MKVVKEFAENYLYYYNEIMKNKSLMKSNSLLLKVGKTAMHLNKDSLAALIDFYNDNTKEEKIKYL